MPFYEILSDSYPHVVLAGERFPLAWDFGRIFNLMTASRFVRITARGMQFTSSPPRIVLGHAWNAISCKVRADALCEYDSSLIFFPNGDVDIPPDTQDIRNVYTEKFPNGACTSSNSKRLLRVNDHQYEVSLCDLVDSNIDVVYDIVNNILYWRQDKTLIIEYILISVVSIYFMSCISGNVISVKAGIPPQNLSKSNLLVVLLVWLYLVLHIIETQAEYVLTYDDLILSMTLFAFVAFELWVAWQTTFLKLLKLSSGISIYTACLMLLAFRIHNTFDNPYNGVLSVMFGTRSFIKYFSARQFLNHIFVRDRMIVHKSTKRETFILPIQLIHMVLYVIGDFCVFGMILYFAIKLSADHLFDAIQQQVLLYVTCILLAVVVSMHNDRFDMF